MTRGYDRGDVALMVEYLAEEHLERAVRSRLRPLLDAISDVLDDESPVLLTDGFHDSFGLLVITDERLIFLPEVEPLSPVAVVTLGHLASQEVWAAPAARGPGDLEVSVDGQSLFIQAVGDRVWAEELARTINDHSGGAPPPRPAQETGGSTFDQCPFCDTHFDAPRGPGELCPSCQFEMPGEDELGPTPPGPQASPGPRVSADGTVRCPYCAEEIRAEAIVCRHCRLPLTEDAPVLASNATTQTNGLAVASLVFGLLWLYGLGSLLALIFGYAARRRIDDSRGREGGRGLAVAGIVLGWIGFLGTVAVFVWVAAFINSVDTTYDY